VETAFSMMKRKFGAFVRSKSEAAQASYQGLTFPEAS
jgi:hypothetical protein